MILIEWNEFPALDMGRIAGPMTMPRLADLRTIYTAQDAANAGFEAYDSVGRVSSSSDVPGEGRKASER